MKTETKNIYPLGSEGNQIEIDFLSGNSYRVICRDHFSENFVDYYVNREELKGLADFILNYLDDDNDPNSHTTT